MVSSKLFVRPLVCEWKAVVSMCPILSTLLTDWKNLLTNSGPLSIRTYVGILNSTIKCPGDTFATSDAVVFDVGTALISLNYRSRMTDTY